jgi:hypothetical protein
MNEYRTQMSESSGLTFFFPFELISDQSVTKRKKRKIEIPPDVDVTSNKSIRSI